MTSALFLSNLPIGISQEVLTDQLVVIFQDGVERPIDPDQLRVTIFEPGLSHGNPTQVATVVLLGGIQVDLGELNARALQIPIEFNGSVRTCRFKRDFHEERNRFGELEQPLPPDEIRRLKAKFGIARRKPLEVFSKSFMDAIGRKIFPQWSTLYAKMTVCDIEDIRSFRRVLNRAGRVVSINQERVAKDGHEVQRINFASIFDALQALIYFNQNGVIFCDKTGEIECTYNEAIGLARNGRLVRLAGVHAEAVLLLSDLKEDMFDVNWCKSQAGSCWRCKTNWTFQSLNVDLNFVGAVCDCTYSEELDILDVNRAYFWGTERFTRLLLDKTTEVRNGEEQTIFTWIISHPGMKDRYTSPDHYRNIAAPIAQDEWKVVSEAFKLTSLTHGRIIAHELVEIQEESNRRIYSMHIEVDKTQFWKTESLFKIGRLTLQLYTVKDTSTPQKRKAKLWRITERGRRCILGVTIQLDEENEPVNASIVEVVAKPVKTEYNSLKQVLNKWRKNPHHYRQLVAILDSSAALAFPRRFNEIQVNVPMYASSIYRMRHRLNEKQELAYQTALVSPISVIQGPPGTGKTFTGAIIASTLALKESGAILCIAPSNYAADNFAMSIRRNSHKPGGLKVLRIYSKKKEIHMTQQNLVSSVQDANVTVLHVAVRNHDDWLNANDQETHSIRRKLQMNRQDLLTEAERTYLEEHTIQIEQDIMSNHRVIVCTVGACADHRILAWNKPIKISSVIVDEAGQLAQLRSLHAFRFGQIRTVFLGDQQQLRHVCASFAADTAGMPESVMEGFRLGGSNIPWTMLEVQHRMEPANRQVVSELTYNGKLKDADVISKRTPFLPNFMSEAGIEPFSSPVVVIDHVFPEERVKTSFKNPSEASVLVQMTIDLLRAGVQPNDITILSLYDAQREHLNTQLLTSGVEGVIVTNVDGYQGRENNVILLSMVRGGDKIGFASANNRLNVALSRSRRMLIIFMNTSTYKKHSSQTVSKLFKLIEDHADIRSSDALYPNIN